MHEVSLPILGSHARSGPQYASCYSPLTGEILPVHKIVPNKAGSVWGLDIFLSLISRANTLAVEVSRVAQTM